MGELGQGAASGLALHDLSHLLADGANLRRAGICGLLDLVGPSLGEGNGKQANEVVVSRLHSDIGLNERLPLPDQGAQLVSGEIQAVEICQAVLSLDFIHTELNLAEGVVLIILQVCKRDLEDATLQRVVGILQSASAVDEGLANTLFVAVSIYSFTEKVVEVLLAGLEGGWGLAKVSMTSMLRKKIPNKPSQHTRPSAKKGRQYAS